MLKIFSKILVVLLLIVMLISVSYKTIYASFQITEKYITKIGKADYHLKYNKGESGIYSYIICDIVGHYEDGKFYPAYCLNKDLSGVGKAGDYTVDVESIYNNDKVWRIIKNGYPNKSAKDLGLESDYDAFVITKLAIYCVTDQGNINSYLAESNDVEGQAMMRALSNLVQIGFDGNERYEDLKLKVAKEGNFKEDGDYYSQTYSVISKEGNLGYNITSIQGVPEGSLITDVNNNIKANFFANEKFKVRIPKYQLNKDININIELESNIKTYPILYGKTRIPGTQNYVLTANTYEKQSENTNLNLKLNTGKIKIVKLDQDTNLPIDGVEFELKDKNGNTVSSTFTNSKGVAEFENLYQGEYFIKETSVNDNYIIQDSDFKVEVLYNKTSEIKIQNEHKKGSLSIKKVDKDNNNIQLGNVEFDLYSHEFGKVIGKYFTDANGNIKIDNLRIGKYSLIEKTTNEWYNLTQDENIEIKWNENTSKQIENELKKGQLQVIKVDKDNNEIKIPNVEFEVLDSNMNLLEKIVTDENGKALTSKYALRDYESLFIKEVKTDERYVLNNEVMKIQLKPNETVNIQLENEKIKGKIKIVKTTEEDSKITNLKKGKPMQGVNFEIYDEKGNVVDNVTTNEQGMAVTKQLEKGKYKIKETKTNEWYMLDKKEYEVEISKNGDEKVLNLTNKPENPEEKVEKVGHEKASPGEEISYKINVQNTGNVCLDNFIWEDNIPSDYINVTKLKTGTYNQDGRFNLYYKTNFSEDYILLLEDISCKENAEIDFSKELAENEYITNIKLDFNRVNVGFKTEESSEIFAKVKDEVKSKEIFENTVCLSSNFKGINLFEQAKWKTEVLKILPITGM